MSFKLLEELSKDELLGIIYHHVWDGRVLTRGHPVICVSCGDQSLDEEIRIPEARMDVFPLGYICDRCEEI